MHLVACEHAGGESALGLVDARDGGPGRSPPRRVDGKVAAFNLLEDMFELVREVLFHVKVIAQRDRRVEGQTVSRQDPVTPRGMRDVKNGERPMATVICARAMPMHWRRNVGDDAQSSSILGASPSARPVDRATRAVAGTVGVNGLVMTLVAVSSRGGMSAAVNRHARQQYQYKRQ